MKAALISDTHGMLPDPSKFEEADFIIHAGDIGPDRWKGNRAVFPWYQEEFAEWARAFYTKPIYLTWGNHDFIGERVQPDTIDEAMPDNVQFLVDKQIEIEGKKVWFSPWSNLFGNWAFMKGENDLKEKYFKEIPDDTQVIVSHGPPYGLGDKIYWDGRDQHVGSRSLLAFMDRSTQLELVICGHIHEARGLYKDEGIDVRNVSLVDEKYQPIFNPIIIDWS